jgi:secreted PhoX family phosphatase
LAGCNGCYSSNYGVPATNTLLYAPTGIAVDSNFNVYIATASQSQYNNQVLLVKHGTGIITVFAGLSFGSDNNADGIPATSATLRYPSGIAVDVDGNVYIADKTDNKVRVVTNGTMIISTFAGGGFTYIGDGGIATSGTLNNPSGLVVDVEGNLFIADKNSNRIRKVTNSINYPTSQPSIQPTGEPSKFVWQPKYMVSTRYDVMKL